MAQKKTTKNNFDSSWESIYFRGKSVRRWPSEDVVQFFSIYDNLRISVDLGTGTGRNLIPIILSMRDQGIVYAIEISKSGLDIVEKWILEIGFKRPSNTCIKVFKDQGLLLSHDRVFCISTDEKSRLNSLMIPSNDSPKIRNIYLVLRHCSMTHIHLPINSVDIAINRGNLSYLDESDIIKSINELLFALKPGGLALVSFISINDSRINYGTIRGDGHFQRIITEGPQRGYRVELFDEERVSNFLKNFKIISFYENNSIDMISKKTISSYIIRIQKSG